jgi:hypothetical protein
MHKLSYLCQLIHTGSKSKEVNCNELSLSVRVPCPRLPLRSIFPVCSALSSVPAIPARQEYEGADRSGTNVIKLFLP